MSKYYYLKYYDKTVAEIDIDNKTMEIINLELFFDRKNKNIMSSVEFNKWVRNRIRPVSQVGFNSFLVSLDLKEDEEDLDCSLGYGETLKSKLEFIVRELKKLNGY